MLLKPCREVKGNGVSLCYVSNGPPLAVCKTESATREPRQEYKLWWKFSWKHVDPRLINANKSAVRQAKVTTQESLFSSLPDLTLALVHCLGSSVPEGQK